MEGNNNHYVVGDRVMYCFSGKEIPATITHFDNNMSYRLEFDDIKFFDKTDFQYHQGDNVWWTTQEFIKPLNPHKVYRKGVRVKVAGKCGKYFFGAIESVDNTVCEVKFDNDKNRPVWMSYSRIRLVNKESEYENVLTIIVDKIGRKTILEDKDGKRVVAYCHPQDVFEQKKGIGIVLERYYNGIADGDTIYTVEANGTVVKLIYSRANMTITQRQMLKDRMDCGNTFTDKSKAEHVAKKIRKIFKESVGKKS